MTPLKPITAAPPLAPADPEPTPHSTRLRGNGVETARDRTPEPRWWFDVRIALCVIGVITFCYGLTWVGSHVGADVKAMFITICLFGGAGGVLTSARESELQHPNVTKDRIRLGWISDVMYGAAGAFAIYLLVPGLSEAAGEGFKKIMNTAGADNSKTSLDFLEMVAVSLIGGLGGRAILKRAAESFLQAKVESIAAQQDDVRRQLSRTVADSNAKMEILTMLNERVENLDLVRLRRTLAEATPESRRSVLDLILYRLEMADYRNARLLLPFLTGLIELDHDVLNHRTFYHLARAYHAIKERKQAAAAVREAIRRCGSEGMSESQTEAEYKSFLAELEPAPPKGGKPIPGHPR